MYSNTKTKCVTHKPLRTCLQIVIMISKTLKIRSPHIPFRQNIDSFLAKLSLPSLTYSHLDLLNAPVTLQEIQKVFNFSKLLKSPGPDGLPNEYYNTFADILSLPFQMVCQSFFPTQPPPEEMLQAIISTIPKPGKLSDHTANFHPISLLNSDIKFISKILGNGINTLLLLLISSYQVGFIPNRQTRDGTRRILDLIQFATLSNYNSVLISLEAEKAFDRVNWLYLQKVLSKFGFSGPILHAISSLYTSPSAKVFTSGFFSHNFPISNKTRQGCPLSPLVFALLIEPLAETIRIFQKLKGL